jgi:predicted DNA-binding antitoxin AbrB/MazE fold protein
MVRAVYWDNSFHLIDPVNLENGDEVEIMIIPDSQVKKLAGVFQIDDIETIDEIIESDIFD